MSDAKASDVRANDERTATPPPDLGSFVVDPPATEWYPLEALAEGA